MSSQTPPGADDDDSPPPTPDIVRRRRLRTGREPGPASDDRKGWGALEISLALLAIRVRQAREEWDEGSENHRRFLAEQVVPELREWAEVGLGLAGDLEAFAAGGPAIADEAVAGLVRCGDCGQVVGPR